MDRKLLRVTDKGCKAPPSWAEGVGAPDGALRWVLQEVIQFLLLQLRRAR